MKKLKLLFAILFAVPTISFSQGEFLIQIDTATGSFTHIGGAINGIHWVFPYIRGYDETHGIYIFQGGMSIVESLYSINVTNGSIIFNPAYSQSSARELKHDNTNDSLYGLYWDNSSSLFFMATVNPATGLVTSTSTNSIPGLGGTSQGSTAYDDIHHRYFALQNNQLFSIDAVSGNLISSPNLGLASGDQLTHFCYNKTLDTLNGWVQNSNTNLCNVVSINTITGAITKIGPGVNFGFGGGSSSIDKINQRYIFTYSTGGSTFYIAAIDIATGLPVSNNLIPLSSGSNIHSISFDNIRGKLFGVQWDASVTSINNFDWSNDFRIYPIPTNETITLESSRVLGAIKIFDLLGNTIMQFDSIDKYSHIDISNLTKGIYFIETNGQRYKIIKD